MMCRSRSTVASLALALISVAAVTAFTYRTAGAIDLCIHYSHGCFTTMGTTVPCSSITCASIEAIPSGGAQCNPTNTMCQDASQAYVFTSAAAAPPWPYCAGVSNPGAPVCSDACTACANITLYSTSPCNTFNQCGSSTALYCATSTGVSCN